MSHLKLIEAWNVDTKQVSISGHNTNGRYYKAFWLQGGPGARDLCAPGYKNKLFIMTDKMDPRIHKQRK